MLLAHNLLYGVKGASPEQIAEAIGSRLRCAFEERESDYFGLYRVARVADGEIRIVAQFDPEGEPLEPDFVDYDVLVYTTTQASALDLGGLHVTSGPLVRLRSEQ